MPRATSIQANQSFPTHSTFCPGDKIGAIICAVRLSKSRMQLRSGARIQGVFIKVPSLFWRLRYSFFLSSFHTPHTQHTNDPSSVGMPRCRGRPYILHMLTIPLLPVVEHCLSPPNYRTNKRRPPTHEFGVLWVLQLTPSPRSDGFGYH